MSLPILKRQSVFWGCTLAALVFLLVVGFLVSQLTTDSSVQAISHKLDKLPFFLLRLLMYGALLFFWSRLVQWLASKRNIVTQVIISRRPLIILIVFYEFLVVQNSIAILFRLLV